MMKRKKTKKNVQKTQISISLPLSLVSKIDELAGVQNRNRSNFIATQLEALADEADVTESKASKKTKR